MENNFLEMLKSKYKNLDIDKALSVFEKKYKTISSRNPVLPLNCDLNKHLFIQILNSYLEVECDCIGTVEKCNCNKNCKEE